MKKSTIFPILLMLMLTLVGCTNNTVDKNNKNGYGTSTNDQNNNAVGNTGAGESATGTNGVNNNNATSDNGQSEVAVADDVAKRITAMDEVENAYVLVTDQHAFVGAVLKKNVKENEDLKSKIAKEVQNEHPEFENVYVSFNPDVAERLTEYGNRIRSGEPVEGFFEEFTTTINRLFPESKYSPRGTQGLG